MQDISETDRQPTNLSRFRERASETGAVFNKVKKNAGQADISMGLGLYSALLYTTFPELILFLDLVLPHPLHQQF
jgi:hypothetical protein